MQNNQFQFKVLSAVEMSNIEKVDYASGASEEKFMEEAGRGVAVKSEELFKQYGLNSFTVLCGKGNNGGDAFVAASYLVKKGYQVQVFLTAPLQSCSILNQKYAEKYSKVGSYQIIESVDQLSIPKNCLIIDGLLGTGFKGSLEGFLKELVVKINSSKEKILSIDIPSGVNGSTGEVATAAIKADYTLFLGFAKTGCFIEPAWNHVGKFSIHDFGLSKNAKLTAHADFILVEKKILAPYFPERDRNIHKYKAGYVIAIAGSPGMPGAAMLSTYAALKSGAGIVRLLHPKGMEAELSSSPYELIRQGYSFDEDLSETLDKASSLLVGPGVGKSSVMMDFLKKQIPFIQKPCVFDAEALFLFSTTDIRPPKGSIFTPHKGEMKRLLKNFPENEIDFLKACQVYANEHEIVLILKGSPTFIFQKGNIPYLSYRGDPGMATAGSGDVLTGIIAAFLAQGLKPLEAALTAVFLHGVAGEAAAKENTSYSVTASDIIHHLPHALSLFVPH